MAKLTTAKRKKIPKKDFALPGKVHRGPTGTKKTEGAYPINDISHARNALARAAQHASPAEQKRIRAAVYKKYPSLRKAKKK